VNRKPKTIGAYRDCLEILDLALGQKGLRVPFDRRGLAINFRQRCYTVRQILQKSADSAIPFSIYDELMLRVEPEFGPKDEPAELVISIRESSGMLGRVRRLDGSPIPATAAPVEDDLLAAARKFRGELDLG
jgi:hypothetical protein